MFRCEQCGLVVKSGVSETKVTTESRDREYRKTTQDHHGNYLTQTSHGEEIVHEKSLCPDCMKSKE